MHNPWSRRLLRSLVLAALGLAFLLGSHESRASSAAGSPTVVVLVQGIGSAASCGAEDDYAARARAVRGRFDAAHPALVIGFSYAERYARTAGCAPAPAELVGTTQATPQYTPADNCDGIPGASARLENLVRAAVRANPGAQVEIVGHSMGGMVAAYYLATAAPESLGDIRSVVYLDAPLRGARLTPELLVQLIPNCQPDSPSWRDIVAGSAVERAIAARTCATPVRQYAVIATSMGASLTCSVERRARGDISGSLAELLPGALMSTHAGVWNDPSALDAIVAGSEALAASAPAVPPSSGQLPMGGGVALFVFGGGSETDLVTTTGCPVTTAAYWASDGVGGFVAYLPGAAVAAVNARWRAQFPGPIPSGTVLLGRCR